MLADFVTSETAKTYLTVCDRFGIDPAAPLEPEDDFLAYQLRAALAIHYADKKDEEEEPAQSFKQTHERVERFRKRHGL